MKRCICGGTEFEAVLHDCYYWDPTGKLRLDNSTAVRFGKCKQCGIVRQLNLPFDTAEEYKAFYERYAPTPEYVVKNWEHDTSLAAKRCDAYNINSTDSKSVLDVGSGSGAFVWECRQRGQEAFGCEIGTYSYEKSNDWIYRKPFEEVGFPTDHFDTITLHDVLEHILAPVDLLKEVFRVVKQNGKCIIDFPRFFHESGGHHWKVNEHIWLFDEFQLERLLTNVGFTISKVEHPIESKAVFTCIKPVQKRKTILVSPGIGDSYWTLVKMESFIEKEKLGVPIVRPVVLSGKDLKFSSEDRAVDFLRLFPFLCADNASLVTNDSKNKRIWNEAYMLQARTIFRNVMGADYLLSWNGYQRVGRQLEEINPHLDCNWHPKMFVSLEQEKFRTNSRDEFGDYIAYYFPLYGPYEYGMTEFTPSAISQAINRVTQESNCKPVFVGAQWDHAHLEIQRLINSVDDSVDLTGKTSIDQLFGLLRGAKAVVGYPSGLTIMAATLYCPTFMLWNNYYNRDFAHYCCPPDTRGKNYFLDFSHGMTSERLSNKILDLIRTGLVEDSHYVSLPLSIHPPKRILASTVRRLPTRPPRSVVSRPISPKQPSHVFRNVAQVSNIMENTNLPTVVCVLKSGGEYNVDYVAKLRNMIGRCTTVPLRFVCLTDMEIDPKICETIPLESKFSGWWSKLEIFREDLFSESSIVVYFDLDTVLIRNIDDVFNLRTEFAGLGGWIPSPSRRSIDNFGSGLMAWSGSNGHLSFLYREYAGQYFRCGDQEYIAKSLINKGMKYDTLQEMTTGIYSYKRNCLHGLPVDARIICFHGRPRPHEAIRTVKWIKSYWR